LLYVCFVNRAPELHRYDHQHGNYMICKSKNTDVDDHEKHWWSANILWHSVAHTEWANQVPSKIDHLVGTFKDLKSVMSNILVTYCSIWQTSTTNYKYKPHSFNFPSFFIYLSNWLPEESIYVLSQFFPFVNDNM